MNSKMKRRLIVVTGVIVVVLAIVLAIVGSSGAAKTISVKDALESDLAGERVQVSGNVVDNSFATVDGVLTFDIYDPDGGDPAQKLHVSYDGAASSTFGNGVTAICTGKIVEGGKRPRARVQRARDEVPFEVRKRHRCAERDEPARLR